MKETRMVKMKPRHVADASRFIAEVLGERRSVTARDLKDFLDWDDDEVLLLVAETGDGSFAGVAGVVYESWNNTGKIEWIGLIEDLRGRSIGSSMLNQMVDWTRSNGGRKIYVDTGLHSEKAIAFYERNGFSREAVLKDWYYDGGDAVLMSRRTAEAAPARNNALTAPRRSRTLCCHDGVHDVSLPRGDQGGASADTALYTPYASDEFRGDQSHSRL